MNKTVTLEEVTGSFRTFTSKHNQMVGISDMTASDILIKQAARRHFGDSAEITYIDRDDILAIRVSNGNSKCVAGTIKVTIN